jgi:Icc-related predicted phosphoesterase
VVKIVAISDLHEQWYDVKIPKCDILINAGDITYLGDLDQVRRFNHWAGWLRDEGIVGEVITIAGNHDLSAQKTPAKFKAQLPDVVYLEDEAYNSYGLKIYGSPWTPSFYRQHWVFNADRGPEIRGKWAKIPNDLDILITHGPPYGVLDLCDNGNVGCVDLLDAVLEKRPKVLCFGHIHESPGTTYIGNTKAINASTCDGKYRPVNPPIVFEL